MIEKLSVSEMNCRTCAHATPRVDVDHGAWPCELQHVALDPFTQAEGCNGQRFMPILLASIGRQTDAVDVPGGNLAVVYTLPDGSTFANGAAPAFSSKEIGAAHSASLLGNAMG